MAKVVVQSILLGSSFVLWAGGLLLCGPATTVMLEYTEVMLLRLGRSVSSRAVRGKTARLVVCVCVCVCVFVSQRTRKKTHGAYYAVECCHSVL